MRKVLLVCGGRNTGDPCCIRFVDLHGRSRIAANPPAPWIGVWERINIGAFLLGIVVLVGALLRRQARAPAASRNHTLAA